nr:hypothetical protein [uncultured Methanoregula sp.]
MDTKALYKPAPFFLIAFFITWTFLIAEAYLSYQGGGESGSRIIPVMESTLNARNVMVSQTLCPYMPSAFVPPSGPVTRESILAGTKPRSLSRKIRLALFDLGIGRSGHGFPYVMWFQGKKE